MPFFNSNNIERHLFSAYTNISSASTFNGVINPFINAFKTTRWEYPDGHVQTTGITYYNIPGSGSRLIKAYINRESNIQLYNIENSNLIGGIKLFESNDVLSKQLESTYVDFSSNNGLNKISLPSNSNRIIRWFNVSDCSLSGQIDLSMFHLSGLTGEQTTLSLSNNSGINSIVIKDEIYKNYVSNILIGGCSIGTPSSVTSPGTINFNTTVDLSRFININGTIQLTNGNFPNGNSAITYVIFPPTMTGGTINMTMNGLPLYTGNSYNLDFSFANGRMGQNFTLNNLPQITGFTYHIPETNSINNFDIGSCNIQGNLDLSNYYGMGGNLVFSNNTGMTAITFSTHQANGLTQIQISNTGIHNLDLSSFANPSGYFLMTRDNPNLTGITLPADIPSGVGGIYVADLSGCDYRDIDFSNTYLAHPYATRLTAQNNPHLTGFTFPHEYVDSNTGNSYNFLYFDGCNIKSFGIENVSGTNNNYLQVTLNDNSMSADIVNEILVKFDNLGWTANTMNIGGNNAAPDHTSGGFDGIAAKLSLSAKSWSISTS